MFNKDFKAMLDCFDLIQYVNFITHTSDFVVQSEFVVPASHNITSAELPSQTIKLLFNTNIPLSKSRVHRIISCPNIRHVNPEDLSS